MRYCATMGKITSVPHLSGAFCPVLQSRSNGYAPSSQDKNLSKICDPSFNKYWGTGSKMYPQVGKFINFH